MSEHAWVRWPSWLVVEFFRAVPVLLLMVFIWYMLGIAKPGSSFWAVVIALMLYNGAVLAEVLRAGVNAVPKGQREAAYAIGMRKTAVMNIVLLPQAVKIMLPAIISQCVVALKDTALGQFVVAPGLTKIYQRIFLEFDNRVPTMFVIASLYILVNLLLTWLATWAQKKFVGEQKPVDAGQARGGAPGRLRRLAPVGRAGQRLLGVTQSRMTPSITTVPSSRTPLTRTGRSGSSEVHCSASVSAVQVMLLVALAV